MPLRSFGTVAESEKKKKRSFIQMLIISGSLLAGFDIISSKAMSAPFLLFLVSGLVYYSSLEHPRLSLLTYVFSILTSIFFAVIIGAYVRVMTSNNMVMYAYYLMFVFVVMSLLLPNKLIEKIGDFVLTPFEKLGGKLRSQTRYEELRSEKNSSFGLDSKDWAILIFFGIFAVLSSILALSIYYGYADLKFYKLISTLGSILVASVATTSLYIALKKLLIDYRHDLTYNLKREADNYEDLGKTSLEFVNLGNQPVTVVFVQFCVLKREKNKFIIGKGQCNDHFTVPSNSDSVDLELGEDFYFVKPITISYQTAGGELKTAKSTAGGIQRWKGLPQFTSEEGKKLRNLYRSYCEELPSNTSILSEKELENKSFDEIKEEKFVEEVGEEIEESIKFG